MDQKACSLSNTKRMCEHRIVFTPKYRRRVINSQLDSTLASYSEGPAGARESS